MKQPNYVLIALVSYLISFFVYLIIPEKLLAIHLDPGELHVHHFVYGILIYALCFPLALRAQKIKVKCILSGLYGFATFLLVDEIQMWLWLTPIMDPYFKFRQLPSILVISTFSLVLLIKKLRENKIS